MKRIRLKGVRHGNLDKLCIYSIQVQPPRSQTFLGTDFGTDGPMKKGPQAGPGPLYPVVIFGNLFVNFHNKR